MSPFKRMIRTALLVDLVQGLAVTLRLYFSRKVTIPYPEKVQEPAPLFRGLPRLFRDERGEPLCVACKACQRACGTNCFDIEGRREEGAKVMRPVRFDWKLDRCTFCGLCVEACPTGAIRFSREFRLTSLDRRAFRFGLADMELGGDDLQRRLAGRDEGDT